MEKNTAAIKVHIKELISGEYIQNDGGSFLKTKDGQEIVKAHILGTIVDKYVSSNQQYGILTLDDSTETIQVRFFKERVNQLSNLKIGDLLEVIGFVKDYENEIYIQPLITKKLDDPNWEILWNLELLGLETNSKKQDVDISQIVLQKVQELDSGEGADINKLIEKLDKYENNKVLEAVRQLMFKGDLFEPKKGFIKVIE